MDIYNKNLTMNEVEKALVNLSVSAGTLLSKIQKRLEFR
jgi:hypothetical protein